MYCGVDGFFATHSRTNPELSLARRSNVSGDVLVFIVSSRLLIIITQFQHKRFPILRVEIIN